MLVEMDRELYVECLDEKTAYAVEIDKNGQTVGVYDLDGDLINTTRFLIEWRLAHDVPESVLATFERVWSRNGATLRQED